jgi:hypothetical protein
MRKREIINPPGERRAARELTPWMNMSLFGGDAN